MSPSSSHPAADRLTRFSDRASAYRSHRPSYPPLAIEALLEGLNPARSVVADVGAGTGISSRLLADRGCEVIAIEPNSGMRSAADPHPRVRWAEGTGEHTGLPDVSVDLVLCAQAFHWMEPEVALPEFRRVLRPGPGSDGRVALMWNIQDETWGPSRQYVSIIMSKATEPPTSPWFRPVGEPLEGAAGFANARIIRVPNQQLLDREGLIGRAVSASYSPREGPAHQALVDELGELFDRDGVNGLITLRYVTEVHLAEVAR